ncbi:hypothetical protein BKA69DRAFT_1051055 [Paraphysoderma sedebokerense]|nr:hypothetical protein BKA69DRAFT_1051055 [Paraphysoderma sedebokerense]
MMEGIPISKLRKKYGINYPDMGNGRYAAKLTDDQWKEFNNAQRVHYVNDSLLYPAIVRSLSHYVLSLELY